jgi:hypothetical protein
VVAVFLALLRTTGIAYKVADQRTPRVWRDAKDTARCIASLATKSTGHVWMSVLGAESVLVVAGSALRNLSDRRLALDMMMNAVFSLRSDAHRC